MSNATRMYGPTHPRDDRASEPTGWVVKTIKLERERASNDLDLSLIEKISEYTGIETFDNAYEFDNESEAKQCFGMMPIYIGKGYRHVLCEEYTVDGESLLEVIEVQDTRDSIDEVAAAHARSRIGVK